MSLFDRFDTHSPDMEFTERILKNDTIQKLKKRPSVEQVFTPSPSIVEEDFEDLSTSDEDELEHFYGVPPRASEMPNISDTDSNNNDDDNDDVHNNNENDTRIDYNITDDDDDDDDDYKNDDNDDKNSSENNDNNNNNNNYDDKTFNSNKITNRGDASDDEYEQHLQEELKIEHERSHQDRLRHVLGALFGGVNRLYRNNVINDHEKVMLKQLIVGLDQSLLAKAELYLLSENVEDAIDDELRRIVGVTEDKWLGGGNQTLLDIDEQEDFTALYLNNAKYLFSVVLAESNSNDDTISVNDFAQVLSYFDLDEQQMESLTNLLDEMNNEDIRIDFELFLKICLELDVNLILPGASEPNTPRTPY